jgi:translation initiation factor IF-2
VVLPKERGIYCLPAGVYIDRRSSECYFIDLHMHKVFTYTRAHGSGAADIAVLVVAVDDQLKSQILEAIEPA